MANFTQYKKLELPVSTERYNVAVANKNNMVIDSELHKLELKNQSQDELLATKESLNATKESLNSEISRAKSSENELSSNIENEINRAERAEREIINELDNYLPIDGTAKDSEKLDGYSIVKTSGKWIYGTIPVVDESGVIEIGKYIDFHKNAEDHSDYYIRVTAKDDGLYIGDKKVLVDGEVLPLTGGTLEANTNPILKLKRIEGNFTGLDFENPSGHLFTIEGYSTENGTGKQLNIFARDWNKSLLRINENVRVIYDYKTKEEKEIVVKGDSVGALELPRINTGDANYKPGKNIFEVKEFSQESENIPTSNYYHIITMQGQDVREEYVTQLAIGMTLDSLYYRRMNKDDWGKWKKILLNGDALPSTGGTIASTTQQMLNLRYSGETGDAIISMFPNNFTNKCVTVQSTFSTLTNSVKFKIYQIMDGVVKQLFEVSDKSKDIHDPKTNTMKPIMVKGDSITPTVKERTFKIKNNELLITGFIGNEGTDITDIIIKAYSGSGLNEGMRFGISPTNGMGYIQAQNFVIDCNLLTLEETRLLQSFTSIRFSKENDSNDYPLLMPATQDFEAGFFFTNKDGRSNITTKAKILSDSSNNFFQYDLPSVFRNDKDSGTNLKLESKEWLVATGIDVKNRG